MIQIKYSTNKKFIKKKKKTLIEHFKVVRRQIWVSLIVKQSTRGVWLCRASTPLFGAPCAAYVPPRW